MSAQRRSDREARRLKIVVLAMAASLGGCADHIGRSELLEQIRLGNAPPIVDVRSRGEFEAAHVPGAVHVPFYSISSWTEGFSEPIGTGQPLVIYCEHGPRAGLARAQLWFVTDHPVRFLEGHMTAWKQDGLPVDRTASDASVGE